MLTVICHIYNEQFLLPFFLRQHAPLFDHGIIVDYASTDDSVAIVRDLCPSWDIVQSRNNYFRAVDVDREVMDIERQVEGWKLVLNVTEQVFHPDLRGYLAGVRDIALALPSVIMVDLPSGRDTPIAPDVPLWAQRHHGYWSDPSGGAITGRSFRYIHHADHGHYAVGRHLTELPSRVVSDLWLLWWGWSPLRYLTERKMQIKTRIPDSDRRLGHGIQHLIDEQGMEEQYQRTLEANRICDLRSDQRYQVRLVEMGAAYAMSEMR